MRTIVITVVAVVLSGIWPADQAQGQRRLPQLGGRFQLLLSETVQKELELSPEQIATVQELWEDRQAGLRDIFQRRQGEGVDQGDLREAWQVQMNEYRKKLEELLQPAQAKRLNQIELQDRARFNVIALLLSNDIDAALALTEEQKKQLNELQPPRGDRQRPGAGDDRQALGARGRGAQLAAELKANALGLLTDDQRQKLDELMGSPVDLSDVRRRFGGLGAGFVGGNREEAAERFFARIDEDGDGIVSKGEAEGSQSPLGANFDRFDVDSDGKVTLAEFKERFGTRSGERAASVFAREDQNNDGKITQEEATYPPLKANFDRFDSDADGGVTLEEFNASYGRVRLNVQQFAERFLATWDTDGDGKVTREELAARRGGQGRPGAGQFFERMDANGDGSIDVEELKQLRRAIESEGPRQPQEDRDDQ